MKRVVCNNCGVKEFELQKYNGLNRHAKLYQSGYSGLIWCGKCRERLPKRKENDGV